MVAAALTGVAGAAQAATTAPSGAGATVRSAVGPGAATAAPLSGGVVPMDPVRLLDTRAGIGAPTARVGAKATVHLAVAGTHGIPSDATAVVLTVTAANPSAPGFVTVYADGATRPNTSNVNFAAHQTVPNLVLAPLGTNGDVALYNGSAASTDLIADVTGYIAAGTPGSAGAVGPLAPARLLDTRTGTGATKHPVAAYGTVHLPVDGHGGVPASGVAAVILNVTVTRPATGGYVTVYADGSTRPGTSNLNFTTGQTVPNLVLAPVGSTGGVALYNGSAGPVDLVADVMGYVRAGVPSAVGALRSLSPARVLDTRSGTGAAKAAVAAHGTLKLAVAGSGGVPGAGVSAVVLNVTVTSPAAAGFVTAYADGATRPNTSNVNFAAHQTVPNLVLAPVGPDGLVALYNGSGGSVQLVADVTGFVRRTDTGSGPNAAAPCGYSGSHTYSHVVWIWLENKGYGSVIGSKDAPYENALAADCGVATNYSGITHPSLPNYIAATGGSTFGITDDSPPSAHPLASESIFSQVTTAGLSWRGYAESMPSPCALSNSGLYAVRHNPATYYTGLRSQCATKDIPLTGNLTEDLDSGSLPSFSFITPNLCNDTHNCDVPVGDAWLSSWVAGILDSADYQAGNTLVVITWDEGAGTANHIPTIVIAPSVPSGTSASGAFDHYSLLRTTEDLLGLPALGSAATATSMVSAFHL